MTKIIQVVQHLKPGGIEVMALEFLKFSHHKKQMKIISLEGERQSAIKAWPRLESIQSHLLFLNKPPGLNTALIGTLKKLIEEEKADIVHTHHLGPYFYAGMASFFAGKKVIHTEHDAWHYQDIRHKTLHKITSFFARTTLVADAKIVAKTLKSQLGKQEITVIKNGIDLYKYLPGDKEKARSAFNLPANVKLLGSAGRLEEVKGHATLIKAMEKLPDTIHLAIAGQGSLEGALREQVKNKQLEKRVHFLGHVENMSLFYQSLDLFCLPSLNEGYPLAPLEAQSCGIQTAVTNVGGASETLCPNTGIILKVADSDDMANKLGSFLFEQNKISPRKFISEHADVRDMANAYDTLAEEIHNA